MVSTVSPAAIERRRDHAAYHHERISIFGRDKARTGLSLVSSVRLKWNKAKLTCRSYPEAGKRGKKKGGEESVLLRAWDSGENRTYQSEEEVEICVRLRGEDDDVYYLLSA